MSLTADERETVITMTDASDGVHIFTCQRRVITALRKKPDHFTELDQGHYGSTEWATFTTSSRVWSPATGAKRQGTPRATPFASGTRSMTVETEQG